MRKRHWLPAKKRGGEASRGGLSRCVLFFVVLCRSSLFSTSAILDDPQSARFDFASLLKTQGAHTEPRVGAPTAGVIHLSQQFTSRDAPRGDSSTYYNQLIGQRARPRVDRVNLKNRDGSYNEKSRKCGKGKAGKGKTGKSGASSRRSADKKGLLDYLPTWNSYRDIITSSDPDVLPHHNCKTFDDEINIKWGNGKGSDKHTSGKAKHSGSLSSKNLHHGKGGFGKGSYGKGEPVSNDDEDDDDDDQYGKGGGKAGGRKQQSKSARITRPPYATSAPSISEPSDNPTSVPPAMPPNPPNFSPTTDPPVVAPSNIPSSISTLMPLARPTSSQTMQPFTFPSPIPSLVPPPLIASTSAPSESPTVLIATASPTKDGANSKFSLEPSLSTPVPTVFTNTAKPTGAATTTTPSTTRPSVRGDGTRVVGTPFTLQYAFPAGGGLPADFGAAEATTIEYLRSYLEAQFAFNPSISLADLSYTVQESNLGTNPVSATFEVVLTFEDNSGDGMALPGRADVDVLFLTAFSSPSVQELITMLQGSGDASFAQTTGVNVVVP